MNTIDYDTGYKIKQIYNTCKKILNCIGINCTGYFKGNLKASKFFLPCTLRTKLDNTVDEKISSI